MKNEPMRKKDVITCDEITNSMKYPNDYEFLDLLKVRSAYLFAFEKIKIKKWNLNDCHESDHNSKLVYTIRNSTIKEMCKILKEAFQGVAEE